jgi:hypothetical protein
MVNPIDLLNSSGNILSAATAVYTNVLGQWAYAIGFLGIIGAVYLKTQSLTIPTILSLTIGVSMLSLFPVSASNPGFLFLIFAVAVVLSKAVIK